VTRVFAIVAPGALRERLAELLENSSVAILGWGEDLEDSNEELAGEADVTLVHASEMPREDFLDLLQHAYWLRDTKVILMIGQISSDWTNRAIRAGIRGILPEEPTADQLSAAIEAVTRNLIVWQPSEFQSNRSDAISVGDLAELVEPLTARETEVLRMLAEGLGNKEIAARLKISDHTVKFHVGSILGKLGASTRTEAVSIALRRGLVLV
jgi:NarL family two-component system response regulator YdfI